MSLSKISSTFLSARHLARSMTPCVSQMTKAITTSETNKSSLALPEAIDHRIHDSLPLDGKTIVDRNNSRCRLALPSLPYTDMDYSGNLSLAEIMRLFQHSRFEGLYKTGKFLDGAILCKEILWFIGAAEYGINKNFYKKAKASMFTMPISLGTIIVNLSDDRGIFQSSVWDYKDDEPLAYMNLRIIPIDIKTRSKGKFPDWFQAKMEPYLHPESLDIKPFHQVMVPDNAFSTEFILAPSDNDINQHTTASTYVRLCTDAARRADKKKYFSNFEKGIVRYNTKGMREKFLGEGNDGDRVTVQTWEDPEEPTTLYFYIFNSDTKKPVYTSIIDYYEMEARKKI